jgi:hypothetical protein
MANEIDGISELVENFSSDPETLMTTLEYIKEQKPFLKALLEMNERAVLRLLSVACTIMPDPDKEEAKAA